ncbi:unnamed protein product, partial [Heterosigma akashiwo]
MDLGLGQSNINMAAFQQHPQQQQQHRQQQLAMPSSMGGQQYSGQQHPQHFVSLYPGASTPNAQSAVYKMQARAWITKECLRSISTKPCFRTKYGASPSKHLST